MTCPVTAVSIWRRPNRSNQHRRAAGLKNLLRFLSTAGETHVPTLQGMHMTIHAEDGMPYTWQTGDTVTDAAPREQYSVMLPPLKTKDAIITPELGQYAIYDGNGYMTNPTDPDDFDHSDPTGGMLRFLNVRRAAPEAVADTIYLTTMDGVVSAANGVLANDLPDPGSLTAISDTSPGSWHAGCVQRGRIVHLHG